MIRSIALMLALLAAVPAHGKETLRLGYLADPSHEAVLWALRNNKVASDTVVVEATPMDIPSILQATIARTYDIIQTAALALPRARERGLDLRIVGIALRSGESGEGGAIWVKKDSPIQTAEQLRGKKLGIFAIGSAGVTLIRIALAESHGLNVAARGGDVEFLEVPPPAMPAALQTGRVDAATLIHAQAYLAAKTGDFRPVVETGKDLNKLFGIQMVSAVLAGYGDKLDAKPALYAEALRLIRASKDYALANRAEVFAAVGASSNIDPGFFATWFDRFSEFPVSIADNDVKAIDLLFKNAIALKILDKAPTTDSMLWSGALRTP